MRGLHSDVVALGDSFTSSPLPTARNSSRARTALVSPPRSYVPAAMVAVLSAPAYTVEGTDSKGGDGEEADDDEDDEDAAAVEHVASNPRSHKGACVKAMARNLPGKMGLS